MEFSLVDGIRRRQKLFDCTTAHRFILENSSLRETVEIEREIEDLLNLKVRVTPLFSSSTDDEDLGRYSFLEIPDVQASIAQAELFQLSYYLLDELELRTCEPELASNFAFEGQLDENVTSLSGNPVACRVTTPIPSDPLWALKNLRVMEAWDVPPPDAGGRDRGEGIFIGQIDTGVNEHIELDGDALILNYGANFIEGGASLPLDPLVSEGIADNPGHGISTASVVISRDLPNDAIVGVAPKASMLPVRSIRSVIRLTQHTVAQGIDYARHNGAQVITMSLGGLPSFALRSAIRRAVADNIIVLAAAGNCVRAVTYPARYRDCIAIGGTNENDLPWIGSCRGRQVDVCAPAEQVYSAKRNSPEAPQDGIDGDGQGTSFAVALTAGVAALWLAHFGRFKLIESLQPDETLQERFRSLLRQTARIPENGNWDFANFGRGIVNAKALLKTDPFTPLSPQLLSGLASTDDTPEIADEIGQLVAEVTGMRYDDLGLNLAQRTRYSLELATLALNNRTRIIKSENNPFLSSTNVSPNLLSNTRGNSSASLRKLLKRFSAHSPSSDAAPSLNQLTFHRGGSDVQAASFISAESQSTATPITPFVFSHPLSIRDATTLSRRADSILRQKICWLGLDGSIANGTGWIVGERTIITAAHNIVDRDGAKSVITVELNGTSHDIRMNSSTRRLHPDWDPGDNSRFYADIGAIYLRTDSDIFSEKFKFKALSDRKLKEIPITVAGYAKRIFGKKVDFDPGIILENDNDGLIYYTADTQIGQSGSPVYFIDSSGEAVVVGVHAYGSDETPGLIKRKYPEERTITSGVRLTTDVVGYINQWIGEA